MKPTRALATLAVALTTTVAAGSARANERHFTFLYESSTLPRGAGEIEPSSTVRIGRTGEDYLGVDQRIECEYGLTDRLQTSIYLNGTVEIETPNGQPTAVTTTFGGVSSEWKFNILRLGVDPLGLAAYLELTVAPASVELEGKIIADVRVNRFLFAMNLVYEHEWIYQGAATTGHEEFEVDLAGGYFIRPHFMVGIEARLAHRALFDPVFLLQDQALFAGPVVSLAFDRFWLAATVMPQWVAFTGATPHDARDLTAFEVVQARLLAGVHF